MKAKVKERLLTLQNWAHDQLTDVIMPWWASDYIMDHENGGMYGNVSINLLRSNDEPRGLTLTGRYVYALSTMYRKFGGQVYLDKATYMFRDMVDRFYDKEFGGAFTTVSAKGEVLTTDKPNYCEAFFIMGCAAYYHATGSEEALKLAMELFNLMETKAKIAPGAYSGNMTRDWQKAEGMGFGRPKRGLKENAPRMQRPKDAIMFAHHLCQAYLRLFQATGDEKVGAALREMVELMMDKLYDPEYHNFCTAVDGQGKRLGTNQSFGHDCEISYLMVNAAEAVGDKALNEKVRRITADVCTYAMEHDFDPWGALYNGGDLLSDKRSNVHVWWAEAEGVSSMLVGYYLTKDERFLDACEKQADIIEKYFVNREHGDWYNNVLIDEEGGRVVDGMHGWDKVNTGKCPFHNSQMCFEVMERVDKLLAE